jgi:hypothetical protein
MHRWLGGRHPIPQRIHKAHRRINTLATERSKPLVLGSEKDTRPRGSPFLQNSTELQKLDGTFAGHCRIACKGEND